MDLRENSDRIRDLIYDGCKLELVEYESFDIEKEKASRLSFGNCSENVSILSPRLSEVPNIFDLPPRITFTEETPLPALINACSGSKAKRSAKRIRKLIEKDRSYEAVMHFHCKK